MHCDFLVDYLHRLQNIHSIVDIPKELELF